MNLGNVVRFWARWNPDGDAVIFGDTTRTWAQLHERTSQVANGMAAQGIGRGDRVGSCRAIASSTSSWRSPATSSASMLVPLNVRLTPPELAYIIDHAGCRAVVADPELADLGARALDELAATHQSARAPHRGSGWPRASG